MSTATKTRKTNVDMSLVEIEARNPRFIPPPADRLPDDLHPLRDRVLAAREQWLVSLAKYRAAERAASKANRDHIDQLRQAAVAGDLDGAPDQRGQKAADASAAREASRAAQFAVRVAWLGLVDAISASRTEIIDTMSPDVDAANEAAARLEQQAAQARSAAQRLTDQRDWLAGIRRAPTGRASTESGSPFQQ